MYLKKIEMFGFKSFPQKTELELSPGVTAIIGPNGCGKSNVADAVKWALGEQSTKNLRGKNMEDVIFNGTQEMEPLSFAEVSLVFDNTKSNIKLDFTEIRITRRLFRSGESQYFINKSPCRLKEIIELFHDTGIGKEAYSIISQGKIEQVLSARPEERRMIFEEAAGVYKYKNRKKEAARRLKETADNLLRVSDLIEELNQQLRPLEGQAVLAREYLACREELKELEVGMLVNEIYKNQENKEKAQEKLDDLSVKNFEKYTLLNQLDSQLTKEKLKCSTGEEEISKLREKLQEIQDRKNKNLGDKQLFTEKIKSFENQIQQLQETDKDHKEKIQQFDQKISGLLSNRENLNSSVGSIKEKINKEEQELKKIEDVINSFKKETEDKLSRLIKEIEEYSFNLKNNELEEGYLQKRLEEINREINGKEKDCQQIENRETQRKKIIKQKEGYIKEQEIELEKLNKSFKEKEENLKDLKNELQKNNSEWERVKTQLDVLSSMEQRHEGFNKAVKEVLTAKEKGHSFSRGIEGVVVDLLQVPVAFEKAIDAALGFASQQIVTKDEVTAKEIINYLKKIKKGRATFLPLSLITERDNKSHIKESGVIGWAKELVTYNKKYEKVFNKLLGRVLVAQDLDSAIYTSRKTNLKFKIVTLGGEVIFPGGAITGGSEIQTKHSFIGRKNALKKLMEDLGYLEKNIKEIQDCYSDKEAEKENLNKSINEVLSIGDNLYKQVDSEKDSLKKLDMEKKSVHSSLKRLKEEKIEAEEKLVGISADNNIKKDKIEKLKKQKMVLESNLEKEKYNLDQCFQQKSEIEKRTTDLKIELSSTEKEINIICKNLKDLKMERSSEELKYSKLAHRIEECKNSKKDLEESLNNALEEIDRLIEKEEFTLERINKLTDVNKKLAAEITDKENQARNLRKFLQSSEKKKHESELEITRLDTELKNYYRRLRDEYNLNFKKASSYFIEVGEKKALEEIARLKERLNELGTVNTGAIKEFDRLKERVEFLKKQREDLREAKNTLHQVISEIDDKMKKNFMETFNSIKSSFSAVFRDFFEGGRAYLKLSDSNDVLESGIEIIAQPPGKKLQNLSLLSGGEKALTAIALLFAFIKTKPTPFCILDEIEVSLDNLNLNRFINYLKVLSDSTQFIVITHRRKSMETAAFLYGVTMEESGVSKVLSMKLPSKEDQQVS